MFADDDCLSNRGGQLFVEGLSTAELVDRFGSPLYVYSETQLRDNLATFTAAFTRQWSHGPFRLLPSVKANYRLAIQHIVRSSGAGADVFGPAEYEITRRVGFDPALVSVNGQKNSWLIEQAVGDGARITVDNLAELGEIRDVCRRLGTTTSVRLRVRPNLMGWPGTSDFSADPVPAGVAMGVYKPGLTLRDLHTLSPTDFGEELELVGLHAHVARSTRDPGYWAEATTRVAHLAVLLHERLDGWWPREIDMGGGFPTDRDVVGQAHARIREAYARTSVPPVDAYAAAIVGALERAEHDIGLPLDGLLLEVEPGRALFGNVGVHLSTVRRMKEQDTPFAHRWVELDTSEVHFPNPEHCRWTVVVADRLDEPATVTADLVGCSCEYDRIVGDAELPVVQPGDLVAFLDTGAYQEASSSNFNGLARPAAVLVQGPHADLIRRRETIDDVLAGDVLAGGKPANDKATPTPLTNQFQEPPATATETSK